MSSNKYHGCRLTSTQHISNKIWIETRLSLRTVHGDSNFSITVIVRVLALEAVIWWHLKFWDYIDLTSAWTSCRLLGFSERTAGYSCLKPFLCMPLARLLNLLSNILATVWTLAAQYHLKSTCIYLHGSSLTPLWTRVSTYMSQRYNDIADLCLPAHQKSLNTTPKFITTNTS